MQPGYKLNVEVKNPPTALQLATQIGLLEFENSELQNLENKDAIVLLAFGTTYKDTRTKTFDAICNLIQQNFSNQKVVMSFTSHIIIKHIKQREGSCNYLTPEETLDLLLQEKFTRIALLPLTTIPGIEYKYDVALFHEYKFKFKKMTLATPLIYWQGQVNQPDDILETLQALDLPKFEQGTAILIMTHGTPDPANAYYAAMQLKLQKLGRNDAHIYTVEGYPTVEDYIPDLKVQGVQKIILLPFTMTAGVHVLQDMEVTHRKILQDAGFKVETILRGIAENKNIRQLFLKHTIDAVKKLQ